MNEITDAMIDAHYAHCPGSPDYVPPPAVYTCEWCKEGIASGEHYVEINGDHFHQEDCFHDWLYELSDSEQIDLLGGTTGTAERECD